MKVVLLAGGFGSRLWPISRKSTPKPFVPLVNGKSFFQITYQRFRKRFGPEDIFISTEAHLLSYVKLQAPEVPDENIILEPERRDILGAIGLATAVVHKYFPEEPMMTSWTKHLIEDEDSFLNAIVAAGEYAKETGKIVSIDSKPKFASVHNGWVKMGKKLENIHGFDIQEIEKHIEKPEKKVADKLFESEDWLINTGYRIWDTNVMLNYYKQYQPKMHAGLEKIIRAWGTKNHDVVLKKEYSKFEKDSIEYGIFEKLPSDVRATISLDMGWEDPGISWEFYHKALAEHAKKTIVQGGSEHIAIDADNNLIVGQHGKMISIIGLSNIAVVDTPDGLLVCKLTDTQKVKDLYAKLEEEHKEYVE